MCMCEFLCFFFNDTATTEIYTLSLHDALPIWGGWADPKTDPQQATSPVAKSTRKTKPPPKNGIDTRRTGCRVWRAPQRSEEHTSELQSRQYLVCRLLLEKKKNLYTIITNYHST